MSKERSFLSRFKPSLLGRVALALLLVGLVPVAFSASRLVGLNRDAMTEQVQNTHALAARSAGERVGSFLASRLSLANGLAGNPALADPLSMPARTLLSQNLQAWAGLGILGIAVVNEAGGEVIRVQLKDPEAREMVDRAIALEPGEPVESVPDSQPPILRFAAPLGEAGDAVWLSASGASLTEVLEVYELGKEADLVLGDARGRVLAGNLRSLAAFPSEMIEQATTGYISGVQASFTGEAGEFIGSFAPVPYASWFVASRQPVTVAHAVAENMRRQVGLVGIGTLVLIGVLLAGAHWSVVRPIRQLARAQRRLAGISDADATGSELDQLRAGFEALEQRLKDQEALGEVFLGRYRVDKVLGSGAMGMVFQAFDPKLEREVAIKTVRLDVDLPEEKRKDLVAQLVHEATTIARFSHPNIVSVYDVEDRAEGAFVAMEFVDGISLELLLWQMGLLESSLVIPLGAAIARALGIAHARGIVHRDIKPANVLLGIDDTVKVSDFGISELITVVSEQSDQIFGTPGYLPPETLEGLGYSTAGDMYSLGVLLYEALAGKRPFQAQSADEEMQLTVIGGAKNLRGSVPSISEDLDSLIVGLLERDPVKRMSASSLAADRLEGWCRRDGLVWKLPGTPMMKSGDSAEASEARWVTTRRF